MSLRDWRLVFCLTESVVGSGGCCNKSVNSRTVASLAHQPYTSRPAPDDPWFYSLMEDKLLQVRESFLVSNLKGTISELKTIPQSRILKSIFQLHQALQRCINVEEKYLEGML